MDLHLYNIALYGYTNAYAVLVGGLILAVICAIVGKIFMSRDKWKNFVGTLFVFYWFLIVIFITIVGRVKTEESKIELRLFWCIKEAWTNRDPLDWYFVTGNIALFIPIGLILPMFFVNMRRWWKTVCVGFSFSVLVEVLQLVLHLGLFELDDMINNTFGCVLGYSLYIIYMWLLKKKKTSALDKTISLGVWMMTIAFLTAAIYLGQPVFDRFFG